MPLPQTKQICFFVARHGQTTLNSQNCFRGAANPPLDATGLKQAQKLADIFLDIDISCIICSDKQRATKTAEIIASAKGLPIHSSEQLRALNVGTFSGSPRNKESEARLQVYLDDPDSVIPGGESLNQFKSRIAPCFQEALNIFMDCGIPPLLVAHSSIVHELGSVTMGDHHGVLVHPGGIAEAYVSGGKLCACPAYKPVKESGNRANTIS